MKSESRWKHERRKFTATIIFVSFSSEDHTENEWGSVDWIELSYHDNIVLAFFFVEIEFKLNLQWESN